MHPNGSFQKQTSAGQRTRFVCSVAVGDYDGHVGLGVKAAKEVPLAILGGIHAAKCNLVPIAKVVLPSLIDIDLQNNQVGDAGCSALVAALSSGATPLLEGIHLEYNPVSAAARATVIAALDSPNDAP